MAILEIKNVTKKFGGLTAIQDISFTVNEGIIHGIIGPNGSGKTTLFNLITGFYKPTSGEILFHEQAIQNLSPLKISRKGLSRTFQNLRLFKHMTVNENLCAVLDSSSGLRMVDYIFLPSRVIRIEKKVKSRAKELLDIFELNEWADVTADSLPYGVQKRLEIARAIATEPKLLLLDEPAAGLNDTETRQLSEIIKYIRDDLGITVAVIEHDMKLVMSICDKITVMNEGELLTEGLPAEVSNNKKVIAAYLGGNNDVAN